MSEKRRNMENKKLLVEISSEDASQIWLALLSFRDVFRYCPMPRVERLLEQFQRLACLPILENDDSDSV